MKKFVAFDNANQLSLEEIAAMGDDGYEFVIENGKIIGLLVPIV